LCKDVAVLPNGAPLVVAENGELYLLISRKKLLDKEGFDSSISPEMIRIIDNQGIKVNSVAVASGVPGDASIDQMIIWAVSDQYSYDQKGKAVYGGSIDISSGEPHILW
jgi:hypothetical protein